MIDSDGCARGRSSQGRPASRDTGLRPAQGRRKAHEDMAMETAGPRTQRGKPTRFQAAEADHTKRTGVPVSLDLSSHRGSRGTQEAGEHRKVLQSLDRGQDTVPERLIGHHWKRAHTDSTLYLPGSLSHASLALEAAGRALPNRGGASPQVTRVLQAQGPQGRARLSVEKENGSSRCLSI